MTKPPITNLENLGRHPHLAISKLLVDVHDWLAAGPMGTERDEKTSVEDYSSVRSYAMDIANAVTRLDLSDDLKLDSLLVLRLAERAVGKAVRRGQKAGELGGLGTNNYKQLGRKTKLPSPVPYVGTGNTAHSIYQMTDNVTDAQFAAALKAAREDGKMSRSYIVRKVTEARTGRKGDARRDIVETARELDEQLRRLTVRLRKLQNDDRLPRNKAEVAARMRFHLADAEIVCEALRRTLDKEEKDEGR